jgi:hydrogenase maturation protease
VDERKQWRAIVAGVGNLLMSDDGVGVHAAKFLKNDLPTDVLVLDVGTAVLHALSFVSQTDCLIVVDAMLGGGRPGTVYATQREDLIQPERFSSVHAMGLLSAIQTLPEHERPSECFVVGVEPAVLAYGMELSPVVEAALPHVKKMVESQLSKPRGVLADSREVLEYAS